MVVTDYKINRFSLHIGLLHTIAYIVWNSGDYGFLFVSGMLKLFHENTARHALLE